MPPRAKSRGPREIFFVGAHDVSQKAWSRLRDADYRRMKYESTYRADLKKYGGELTPAKANKILEEKETPGRKVAPAEPVEDYANLSSVAQRLYGESLPTIRLWFHYAGASGNEYIIGAIPDGVAESYCYEFKSTSGNDDRLRENRKMAVRQAILYADAFQRPAIKVQLVRFQLPGPFPFKVRDLPPPEILAPIERRVTKDDVSGILKGMDYALSGRPAKRDT